MSERIPRVNIVHVINDTFSLKIHGNYGELVGLHIYFQDLYSERFTDQINCWALLHAVILLTYRRHFSINKPLNLHLGFQSAWSPDYCDTSEENCGKENTPATLNRSSLVRSTWQSRSWCLPGSSWGQDGQRWDRHWQFFSCGWCSSLPNSCGWSRWT